nr:hypothetical protein [candidate division Zixibacteria bacterium]
MEKFSRIYIPIIVTLLLILGSSEEILAQVNFSGDFRLRAYSDHFYNDQDGRGNENYIRHLARIRAKIQANRNTFFYTELITWTQDNPLSPVRNISGTGRMQYGISQVFAEIMFPDLPFFDLVRLRAGRQQFPIGNGLSMGESYYFFDKFDGVRLDMAWQEYSLSLFGAITGQNVSASGLYPDPGSDQIYIARLSRPILNQDVMTYYIYNKLRGDFNDSYIWGGGASGDFMAGHLDYFVEGAGQWFNTLDGLPDKGGLGYMGGISYRWSWGPFHSIKAETRYAAYQGDDIDTPDIETFSPLYPSFFWGSRVGYVNGAIGGDFPYNGRNPEGSRILYTRLYVIPSKIPALRIQLQYLNVGEYVDNDDYNSMDDEFSLMFYYELSKQARLQFRFARNIPNEYEDRDVNESGQVSWSEDRISMSRFMTEIQVVF